MMERKIIFPILLFTSWWSTLQGPRILGTYWRSSSVIMPQVWIIDQSYSYGMKLACLHVFAIEFSWIFWENSMKKRTQSYKTCFDAFRIKMKREWSAVDSYEMLPKETYFTKEETFRHSNNNISLWKVGSLLYSYYSTNCQFVLLKYKLTPFNLWIATTSLIVCPD